MKIYNSMLDRIGNTPLIKLEKITNSSKSTIFGKAEFTNPGGSIKDRIAFSMITTAEKEGRLKKGSTIIEPTSGNTGIGLAWISAIKGYKIILTMPESMSIERRKLLQGFGAELLLTPKEKGMKGAIEKANEIFNQTKNALMPMQFDNPANPEIHYKTTGPEIWKDTDGKVDIFIAGVGTGGTITGVGKYLKEKNPEIKIIAVEPKDSPVLSGGQPAPHKIQGIGAGFVPSILNRNIIDEIITVSNEDAINTAKKIMQKEGMSVGISSGANIYASIQVSKRTMNDRKIIVTTLNDTGERYISTDLFNN